MLHFALPLLLLALSRRFGQLGALAFAVAVAIAVGCSCPLGRGSRLVHRPVRDERRCLACSRQGTHATIWVIALAAWAVAAA